MLYEVITRVFISYSHDNKEDVETLAKILEKNNLIPIYDADLPGGFDFNDLLKRYIEHSHVFMPRITSYNVCYTKLLRMAELTAILWQRGRGHEI